MFRGKLTPASLSSSKYIPSPDFIRFGIVGASGFLWDTATVYALRGLIGLYGAGTAGFIVAATANWATNRVWTFRHKTHAPAHQQWIRFLLANLVGFVVNRGLFFLLVATSVLCHRYPVLAIIAGSFAGLGFNYFLSKKFVFK